MNWDGVAYHSIIVSLLLHFADQTVQLGFKGEGKQGLYLDEEE